MAHDVFISYSTKDKPTADAVCATLESRGIRCWIAPRDILPGVDWGEAIIEAIEASRVMVLVFSHNANESPQIKREVERAVHKGVAVVPVRIEDVPMSKSLEFFVSTPHWLDALSPPLERHLAQLADTLKLLLERVGRRRGALTEADLEAAGADSTVKPPAQPPARPPVVPPAESRPAMPPPGETQPQAAAGQAQPGSGAGAMTGEKPISARPAVPPVLPVPPQMPPQRPPQGSSQGPNMPPRLPLPPRPAGPLGFLDSWFGPMNPNTRTLILVVGIVVLLLLGCVFLSCLGSVLNHA